MANERLGDIRPLIPLGKKFWELDPDEKWNLGLLLDDPDVKKLILTLNRRSDAAKVELIDAAYWMKGCSSLGKLRYAALVHVTGERKDKFSLVDVKEAGPSAAPTFSGLIYHLTTRSEWLLEPELFRLTSAIGWPQGQ